MAESSESPKNDAETETLIKKAGVLRAKYKVGTHASMMPLQCLGIHQHNRSGVFPQWQRTQSLMTNIFTGGFSKEVAWHMGVCVQEIPPEHQPAGYVTLHDWNKKCSLRHTELDGFLRDPDRVTHGTLSRSHLTVILKLLKNQKHNQMHIINIL